MTVEVKTAITRFFRLIQGADYKAAGILLVELFPDYLENLETAATICRNLALGREISSSQFKTPLPNNIFSTRLFDAGSRYLDGDLRKYTIGPEFDYLQHRIPDSLEAVLNKVLNLSVKQDRDIAIVSSCRNEGPWLLEWLAFHRAVGISDVFLGYNDLTDGSEQLIGTLADNKFIYAFENVVSAKVSPQKKFTNFCGSVLGLFNRYKWVIFIDIDEFFVPEERFGYNVFKTLENIEVKQPGMQAACFHWRWYSSRNQYEWEPGLITDRFLYSNSEVWVKTAVKSDFLWSAHHVHTPETIDPTKLVNSSGIFVESDDGRVKPAAYDGGQINHYFAKSFVEFSLKKSRGRGAAGLAGPQRDLSDFLWGQDSGKFVGGLPDPLRERLVSELDRLRSIPAIAYAVGVTEGRSRQQAADLAEKMQLRVFFDQLTSRDESYGDK